jgi:uncharacterized membrane protein
VGKAAEQIEGVCKEGYAMSGQVLVGLLLNLVGTIIVFVGITDFMKWVHSLITPRESSDKASQESSPYTPVLNAYREKLLKKGESRLAFGFSLVILGLSLQFTGVMFDLMSGMIKK